ncbi:MAG: hypothetical protein Q8P63_03050, partial [Candidatus Nealsonbacteria bacterium]|nr:hypothetical protein [Candidatus Nealsonbacteria bacterium]
DPDPYYLNLDENQHNREKKYRNNINDMMKEKFLESMRQDLDRGIFGSPNFIQITREKFKIKSLKPPGRPRKNQS